MSEATQVDSELLKLAPEWRLPHRDEGATILPLRVVPASRSAPDPLDAEALRALVAEIVREELRSDLGRRMTGSIRGLVRDEVAHIFARIGTR